MMITPADTPPAAPPQLPATPGGGPAPVPYRGPDMTVPVQAALPDVHLGFAPGAGVLDYASPGITPLAAPNVTPPDTYPPAPIDAAGDPDAGGRDIVAATVAASVTAAQARAAEMLADTYSQGSAIGDLMNLPPATAGDFGAAFYDPPRDYGETP